MCLPFQGDKKAVEGWRGFLRHIQSTKRIFNERIFKPPALVEGSDN